MAANSNPGLHLHERQGQESSVSVCPTAFRATASSVSSLLSCAGTPFHFLVGLAIRNRNQLGRWRRLERDALLLFAFECVLRHCANRLGLVLIVGHFLRACHDTCRWPV